MTAHGWIKPFVKTMKKELRKLKDTKTIILIIGSFNLPTFTHYYQGKTNIFYDEQG
jgi:hypothetical protein